jgi:hypothetical protein
MSKSRRPTMEHSPVIAVVVIGGPDSLIESVRRVTGAVTAARVVTSDVAAAATKVAAARPFALVISEELYSFDADEFEALARDVQASVIALRTDGVPARTLDEWLSPKILDAFRKHFRE